MVIMPELKFQIRVDVEPFKRAMEDMRRYLIAAEAYWCEVWLDELGVNKPHHREAILMTLRDLELYADGKTTIADVARVAAVFGYPTRRHRFCRWFRWFWLERRW